MRHSDDFSRRLRELITAGWRTRLVYEGVKSGLIDGLGDAPRTAGDCARRLGLDEDAVLRVLRALATLGLCEQVSERAFVLTPLGARLQSGAAQSMRGMALHWGGRIMETLETIGHTLETGEPGHGGGDFDAMHADPVKSDVFNRSMAEQSLPIGRALAQTVDFGRFARVFDVGGGYGAVLSEVLRAFPALRGAVCDLPGVEAGARRFLDEAGVGDRADFLAGSFFEEVSSGADCLVLKYILHDWSDAEVTTIMANCRQALPKAATVVVVEKLMPLKVGPGDESVVRSDLVMMPINGRERTLGEYEAIAGRTGFALRETRDLVDDCSAIELEAV